MVQCVADAGICRDLVFVFPPIFNQCDIGRTAGGNRLAGYIELGISQKFLRHNVAFGNRLLAVSLCGLVLVG